jgi:hypothetical protein
MPPKSERKEKPVKGEEGTSTFLGITRITANSKPSRWAPSDDTTDVPRWSSSICAQ